MPAARPVGPGFFPLDEVLELGTSRYCPRLVESIVLLGTLLPFERVPAVLAFFTQVTITPETARRLTEAAGAAAVALEAAAVARIERTLPDSPARPAVQLLSVDGAMVPLVKGEWAEVKTLVVGTVVPGPPSEDDTPTVRTTELSYFSRLADADTFGRLATLETHRRGTLAATTVCGVTDGAPWCQGFLDLHRPDAVRILDFPHAVGYLSQAAQARYPDDPRRARTWLTTQRHTLRHGDPAEVLAALSTCAAEVAPASPAQALIQTALSYLELRRDQIRYAHFAAAGYPIGSGSVESANKLVIEARLKGSGMHWARANVNPLACLRAVLCSERWTEAWPAIWHAWRATTRQRASARREARRLALVAVTPAPPASAALPEPMASAPAPAPPPRPKLVVNGKPTKDHPWKQGPPLRRAS